MARSTGGSYHQVDSSSDIQEDETNDEVLSPRACSVPTWRRIMGNEQLPWSRDLCFEYVASMMFYLFGSVVPDLIESKYHWERAAPYQILEQSGDVVLNLELSHAYTHHETVDKSMRSLLCIYVPLCLLVVVSTVFGPARDAPCSASSFFVGCGATKFITNLLKFYVARLRPNFYSMCGFNKETLSCEGNAHDVRNAQRSFPSGHASLAFASMTFLTLYFMGKVGFFCRSYKYKPNQLVRIKLLLLLSTMPMALAFFVAASRLHDNMHHPADVAVGSLIGFGCAVFSYFLWYPSVSSPWSGVPRSTIAHHLATRAEQSSDEYAPDVESCAIPISDSSG